MSRKLSVPSIRDTIKNTFALLYDQEFQKSWFDSKYKHSFWDSLCYYVFDYLFDRDLADEDYEAIGTCVYDEDEAGILQQYLDWYSDNFKGEMPDDYYVNHPKWPLLIEGAKKIVEMMKENEEKYDFESDLKEFWEEFDPSINNQAYSDRLSQIREEARKNIGYYDGKQLSKVYAASRRAAGYYD